MGATKPFRARKCALELAKSSPGKPKNDKKIDQISLSGALGCSGALGTALETAPGRAGDSFGAPTNRPGTDLGSPEAGQERLGSVQKPSRAPRRPRTTPEQCLSAFGAPSAVAHVCGTNFHLFCVVAHKLRCAFRISFDGVLLTSDEISAARARTATTLENQGVSASKIDLGRVWATQNRAQARLCERGNAV